VIELTSTVCASQHSMVVKGLQEVNRLVGTPGGGVPFHAEAVMDAAWSNDREGMYQPVKIQDHFWLVPVWCEVQRQPCDYFAKHHSCLPAYIRSVMLMATLVVTVPLCTDFGQV
jgi:ribosomal protein L11 methylase PrmA